MPVCQSCESFVVDGAQFCSSCGKPMSGDEEIGGKLQIRNDKSNVHPETFDFPKARKSKRLIAGLIDCLIILAVIIPMYRLAFVRSSPLGALVPYIIPCLYILLRDAFGGRSIGKLFTGLVTFNIRNKKNADFADSIIRNWFLTIIIIPPRLWIINLGMILFGVISVIIMLQILYGSKRRLGDGWANTQVVEIDSFETLERGK